MAFYGDNKLHQNDTVNNLALKHSISGLASAGSMTPCGEDRSYKIDLCGDEHSINTVAARW